MLETHSPTGVTLPPGYTSTYALVNEDLGVSHYPKDYTQRNLCLLHVANYPDQVEGCIGWGREHIINDGKLMVTKSKDTVKELLDYIAQNDVDKISITHYFPGMTV